LGFLNEHKADIVMGCESHLDDSIKSPELLPANYSIRKDRNLGGGGVFISIRNNLAAVVENLPNNI